jgi:hypothetical protein
MTDGNEFAASRPLPCTHLDTLLSKLRPFQRSAFDFAVQPPSLDECASGTSSDMRVIPTAVAGAGTGRILLGDEMGLGKTITSLAIMLAYERNGEWPLLILCPASLRYTWPAEIEQFVPWIPSQSIHCVRGSDDVHFASQICKWRTSQSVDGRETLSKCPIQIVIVTYSLLQTRYQIANALQKCKFQCIIADESHNLKQINSQRCQLALPLLQHSKRLVLLSGTPALNRPVELWPQLHALDVKGLMFGKGGMRYNEYTKRYCNAHQTRFGYDIKGSSNADELHECLKTVMIRRLKSQVLHDLPAKQRSIVPVCILNKDKERESRDTMNQLKSAQRAVTEVSDLDASDVANSAQWEARRLLMRSYQASGIAKAPSTTEYILDWLDGTDSTQKLVVFAHHKEVMDYIETNLASKYKGRLGMIRIDGSVPPAERALRVKKFQSNINVRLAILSMTAAGVGLTLTAASDIVFAELHWTPGVLAQCEDRCHRIGQASSVSVMYCICKDEEVSVDISLWSMLSRKVSNLGRVVDGERGQLNAVEQEINGERKMSSRKGASVEDELVSFFATNSNMAGEARKQKCGPIVKGTIQSFFTKQVKKSQQKEIALTASSSKLAACISLIDEIQEDDNQEYKTIAMSPKDRKKSSTSVCISLIDEDEDTPTKVNQPGGQISALWSCTYCTYINQGGTTLCDVCGNTKPLNLTNERSLIGEDTKANPHREDFDFDDGNEWNEADLADIDFIAQNHKKAARVSSPNDLLKESLSLSQQETKPTELLSFAVSLNSGRVAIYQSSTSKPLNVNFDIAQVLTKSSADELEESHLLRNSGNSQSQNMTFDDGMVRQVLIAVDCGPSHSSYKINLQRMCEELKEFVLCYLSLREVEKKFIKESGDAFTTSTLKCTLAKLLVSTVTGTTERYQGGAKERAIQSLKNGCANEIDLAVINGRACAWCAKPFFGSIGSATYCSHSCAEEGRVRRGGMYSSSKIREQLFALEHGKCTKCKIDAHALYFKIKALQPAERLNALLKANWKLPKSRQSMDRLLVSPQEHDFWQADHILAVSEGGGSTGLDNIRTLCTPCHQGETEKLAGRLKTLPSSINENNGRRQMDIYSAFSNHKSHEKDTRKRKRVAD